MSSFYTDPFPHEIHITINPDCGIGEFMVDCKKLGIKPIWVRNYTVNGEVIRDVLTGQSMSCNSDEAHQVMEFTARSLSDLGYTVIRKKIETAPTHSIVPTRTNAMPLKKWSTYFESHIKVMKYNHWSASRDDEKHEQVMETIYKVVAAHPNVHFSAICGDNFSLENTYILTFRERGIVLEDFKEKLRNLTDTLLMWGGVVTPIRPEIEYAIYDSNPQHDDEWMKKA